MKKLIVSDTSPLIALAKLDCLDLLFVSFDKILIPKAVYYEATHDRYRLDSQRIHRFIADNETVEIHENVTTKDYYKFKGVLDEGESQALALAKQLSCGVLIDERLGRLVAKQHQIPVTGVMGILLQAKKTRKRSVILNPL
jgi:predicted nucleic acid-binding protein